MKKKLVKLISLVFVVSLMMAACSGSTPSPQAEAPKTPESVVAEEPTVKSVATEEPTVKSVATEEPTAESVVTEEPTEVSVVTEEPTEESVATAEPTAKSVATEKPETIGPRTGDKAPDFTLPDGNGAMLNLVEELQENEQVVLVFYFGVACSPCMGQLLEIEKDHANYEENNAQVIAVAVQSERHAQFSGQVSRAQFPILADSEQAVAEAYGVLDAGLSTPSVFIINKDRQIVWSEVSHIEGSGCGTERVSSQTILENLG